jgi:glutaminase
VYREGVVTGRRQSVDTTGNGRFRLAGAVFAKEPAATMSYPSSTEVAAAVTDAYAEVSKLTGGKNADYIPFLATVPRDLFGVAVVTRDGRLFEAGDTRYAFAIESISKVATLALVIDAIGPEAVHEKIGADPTGLPFNSIIALELNGDKPLSPLVNAGAIAAASLVPGADADDRWAKILLMQSRLAGRTLGLSEELNRSEQDTNFHNRAIAWLL